MNINQIVLLITFFIICYNLYRLLYLKLKTEKKIGVIIDFKEKAAKRYMYFLPILKVKDSEEIILWENNPKLDKKMLNKEITLLVDSKNKIYESNKIIVHTIILLGSFGLALFAIKNLNLL